MVENNRYALPLLLLMPQLIITLLFFIVPACSALYLAFHVGDPFGIHSHFSGLDNFNSLLHDPSYLYSLLITVIYALLISILTMAGGLAFAVLVDKLRRGRAIYMTLLIWPYAVAPAVAGIIWRFLFNPAVGVFSQWLLRLGILWDYRIHPLQAFFLVLIAGAWQQLSYNFIFILAGLQGIPVVIEEAARLDGAGTMRRFFTMTLPLLGPTLLFLLVMNGLYAFFDTFALVQIITRGGPSQTTLFLVYKVYNDGFTGLDFGGASAQSVILMIIVLALSVIQFKYLEKRIHYQ